MILTATINEVTRKITFDNPHAVVAVVGDYEVNGVAFAFPSIYEDDFNLSEAVKTVYYEATDGNIYNHIVTETDTDTGYPLWVFKDEINKGEYGDVSFALVCDKVENGTIVKRWVSLITVFRVQRSIPIDEAAQEDNEQTYSERLAYLMTQMANMQATVNGLASGAPTPESLVANMQEGHIYVYTGTETGYTAGHLYYYVNGALTDGGQYGGTTVDTTLTVSGAAADAKVVGDEIAEIKEDLNDVSNVLFEKTVDAREYEELDSGSHYKDLGPFDVGKTYKIIMNLVGFTEEQAGLIFNVSTYSITSNTGLVDQLDFGTFKSGMNVAYYTPTANARYIKVNLSSRYSSDTNKSVWTIWDLTDNAINVINAKIDDHIADYDNSKNNWGVTRLVNNWEVGGYSFSGQTAGNTTTAENRRRANLDYITNAKGTISVKIADGYAVNIVMYQNDGNPRSHSNYVSATTQTTGETSFEYDPTLQYAVMLRKTDGTTFDAYADNVLTSVTLSYISSDPAEATSVDIVRRNDQINTTERLQQLGRPTRTAYHEMGIPPLVLLHFSDIHGDQVCLNNVMQFYRSYKSYIADILHTGDTVDANFSDGIGFWNVTDGTDKILNVIGNHDTLYNSVWIGKTMTESYAQYFAPYITNWGVQSETDKTYYYKDYTTNNVRLIVLDVMHQTADQLTWFTNLLTATLQTDYHVLVAVHARAWCRVTPFLTPWDDQPVVPYEINQNDTSASSHPQNLSESYINAVDDFIDNNGRFICWLHGHTHYKMLAKITGHERQIDVAVGTATMPPYAWNYVQDRVRDTLTEDNFNVFAVDTVSNIFRMTKIGVRHDRFMRDTETIAVNYENQTMI